MSEEVLRNVRNMLALGMGDSKRLLEIMNTIKEGAPLLLSDYKYVDSLVSKERERSNEDKGLTWVEKTSSKRDEYVEILRIRLAEGHITIDEFRELKRILRES